ncbi:hypothetical protein [Solidesulfovibrio alcoholivorans]|uniref:hypothetical protein n=1 Tax=Solidesulfovibrio alcoholivorans TaxID=81406 RepID=UPI0012EBAAF3|nr:hypothetical protein [Solidesulfovibrio alcoholivorans]
MPNVINYFSCLDSIARYYFKYSPPEKQFIQQQAAVWGIQATTLQKIEIDQIDFEAFDQNEKLVLLRDLITLACLDGHVSASETEAIQDISKRMKLPYDKAIEIENWLKNLWELFEKGAKIFEASSNMKSSQLA